MNRKEYEADLAHRKREHINQVQALVTPDWKPCLHDQCLDCVGTGVKRNGDPCPHMVSCNCPRCAPGLLRMG
jgi:hypothetical protein